jgi:glycerophosphoryl diester phosphodiesterase
MPLVTAHTGCEGTPENSLESIRAGIDAGADTVEIDVRATWDRVPILMHDDHVVYEGRTTEVEELTLAQINTALPRPAVTLDEALAYAAAQEVTLNLDLKDDGCIHPTVSLVRHHGLSDRVIITGCGPARAAAVRASGPELPVLLNVQPEDVGRNAEAYLESVERICRTATENGCCGINIPYLLCRRELVQKARSRYLPVSVWTVDEEAAILDMADMGVDSITTFHPSLILELFARRAS